MATMIVARMAVATLAALAATARAAGRDHLSMRINLHGSCTLSDAQDDSWRAIEFAGSDEAPFERDPCQPECWSTTGTVKIERDLSTDLAIFMEMKLGLERDTTPEPCFGHDAETGCGGFGSCLYCRETCEEATVKSEVTIRYKGDQLSCVEKLKAGTHKDVTIRFCLPTAETFYKALEEKSISRDATRKLLDKNGEIGVFMQLYTYETDRHNLNEAVKTHHRLYAFKTNSGKRSISTMCYKSLPFVQEYVHNPEYLMGYGPSYWCRTSSKRADKPYPQTPTKEWTPPFVGCHVISGTLRVPDDKIARGFDAQSNAVSPLPAYCADGSGRRAGNSAERAEQLRRLKERISDFTRPRTRGTGGGRRRRTRVRQ